MPRGMYKIQTRKYIIKYVRTWWLFWWPRRWSKTANGKTALLFLGLPDCEFERSIATVPALENGRAPFPGDWWVTEEAVARQWWFPLSRLVLILLVAFTDGAIPIASVQARFYGRPFEIGWGTHRTVDIVWPIILFWRLRLAAILFNLKTDGFDARWWNKSIHNWELWKAPI